MVLRFDFGETSLLITGDAEEVAMEGLIKKYQETSMLDIDIYQLGHHGSKNGTTAEFAKAMSPVVAVSSQGNANKRQDPTGYNAYKFAHPNKKVIDALLQVMQVTSREPKQVLIGLKGTFNGRIPPEFETFYMEKAIYSTGWDGDVVIKADVAEKIRVLLN